MDCSTDVLSSQLDWLTATAWTDETRRLLRFRGMVLHSQVNDLGEKVRTWGANGYRGFTGGGVTWGDRADDTMFRVSGPRADEEFTFVDQHARNISRIDLAVTVRCDREGAGLHRAGYAMGIAARQTSGFRRKFWVVDSSDGGGTLYVGRRSSAWFGRLYDKGVESGDPAFARCWRYEVEAKDEASNALRSQLCARQDRGAWIRRFVHGWFSERGVVPVFTADGESAHVGVKGARTDRTKQLGWLRTTAGPVIRDLWRQGAEAEITEALFGWMVPAGKVGVPKVSWPWDEWGKS